MIYKRRALRRLWAVDVFHPAPGEAISPDTPITEETVIAWNAVDAIRASGHEVATPPRPLCFITWDEPPQVILSPTDGPTGEEVSPTIATAVDW